MADLQTGGAPVDTGAQPSAPGGAPMAVPPSQQGDTTGAPAPAPAVAGPRRQQAPPPPLIGDEAFLAGPSRGMESTAGALNQTGPKVPPPPDAQAWLPWLVQSANMPDASPGLKSLVQLLTYHLSS